MKDCKLPIDIGSKALTQSQLESLWITDRISLLDCARRHKALRDFIADRDAGLGKK
ncbi:anaerobic dehydrogenase [Rhizobium tumorigenes]|uniref:anaerobic dehydrogenase n=1 Tax=Rhizobium tumorigenes TaxID=2041385 RepID=UPI00241C32C5|nr:anaerobic dehydrogenase [Rhizobium tumorigenes]WFS02755.1 anaerobic dehydrogenase [Rhizobium tumorigenes]